MLLVITNNEAQSTIAIEYAELHQLEYKIIPNFTEALKFATQNELTNIICKLDIGNQEQLDFLKNISKQEYYSDALVLDFDQLYDLVKVSSTNVRNVDEDLKDAISAKSIGKLENSKKVKGSLKLSHLNKFDLDLVTISSISTEVLAISCKQSTPPILTEKIILKFQIGDKYKHLEFTGSLIETAAFDYDKLEKIYYEMFFDETTKTNLLKIMKLLNIDATALNLLLLGGTNGKA